MFGSGLNEVYDFDTYRWSNWPQAAVSGGSWATCMVSWHDCLIVFGAADSAGLLNKVQLFNTTTSVSFFPFPSLDLFQECKGHSLAIGSLNVPSLVGKNTYLLLFTLNSNLTHHYWIES